MDFFLFIYFFFSHFLVFGRIEDTNDLETNLLVNRIHFALLSMLASVTQHLHAQVVCHSSLSHSVCDSSSCKQCLWKVSMLFYFFGLIPNASVLLFFFGFILIEWYFYVWCNTMKTYIINRLHHGFKEYCCFVYH